MLFLFIFVKKIINRDLSGRSINLKKHKQHETN